MVEGVGTSVLIVGLGESGLAAAHWCSSQGAKVTVLDSRDAPVGLAQVEAWGVTVLASATPDTLSADAWQAFECIVVSPGLSPQHPLIQRAQQVATEKGIELWSEIELFGRVLLDLQQSQGYRPRLIGITGTNGKTTTTALVTAMLQRAGCRARAAGNISPAAVAALHQALLENDLPDYWVLELSSFQLQHVQRFRCDAAVILNLAEDHLDWHGDMAAYIRAKLNIFHADAVCVLPRGGFDHLSVEEQALIAAHVQTLPHVVGFGANSPQHAGDWGLVREHGMLWLAHAKPEEADQAKPSRRGSRQPQEASPFTWQHLMPMGALRITGRHNALNALAALALVTAVGVPLAPALHALRDYRGEPHRVMFLQTVAGVDFIEDSKGTNVAATVAALQGLERPVVLIAGGVGKGQSFAPLARAIVDHAKALVLIGEAADEIALALDACPTKPAGFVVERASDLSLATRMAASLATPGDVVLLSPACASFDMFKDYAHRAAVFAEAVQALALDHGDLS